MLSRKDGEQNFLSLKHFWNKINCHLSRIIMNWFSMSQSQLVIILFHLALTLHVKMSFAIYYCVYTLLKIILPFGCVILVTTTMQLHNNNNNNNRTRIWIYVKYPTHMGEWKFYLVTLSLWPFDTRCLNNMHISHSHHLITPFLMLLFRVMYSYGLSLFKMKI